jgi:hypothetical protein
VGDFVAPTLYFGLRVGIIDRPRPASPEATDRAFALTVENPTPTAWRGRVPIVWAQAGVSWTETFDVELAAGERRTLGLATHWSAGGPSLEARLPSERSPQELAREPTGETERWALTSRYVPLGAVAAAADPAMISPAEDRRDRIRLTVWLVIAGVVAVVAAVLLIVYATSVL